MIDVIHFTCWSCYCCGVLHQQWCDAVSYSTYNMDAERVCVAADLITLLTVCSLKLTCTDRTNVSGGFDYFHFSVRECLQGYLKTLLPCTYCVLIPALVFESAPSFSFIIQCLLGDKKLAGVPSVFFTILSNSLMFFLFFFLFLSDCTWFQS